MGKQVTWCFTPSQLLQLYQGNSTWEPASTACNDEQGDPILFCGPTRSKYLGALHPVYSQPLQLYQDSSTWVSNLVLYVQLTITVISGQLHMVK